MLHQVGQGGVLVVQHTDGRVDHLPQIVGGDVGGHAHGDAGGAIHQQVGEAAGQHPGLLAALIVVGVPVYRVLVDIPEHLVGHTGQAGLGIPGGGGGIAVHVAKVSVALHQRVAHGKLLGQTDHRVVDGRIPVGMVLAHHVAHAGGRLFKRFVGGQPALIHGVENPAVNGLQPVPHVGQGTAHDDAHGILLVALRHLPHQL